MAQHEKDLRIQFLVIKRDEETIRSMTDAFDELRKNRMEKEQAQRESIQRMEEVRRKRSRIQDPIK